MTEKQTKPCPDCGETAGWWSALTPMSMTFFETNGNTAEYRLFYKKRKNCAKCDSDITACVQVS